MFTSLNLLKPMGEEVRITGEPVRGAGWYGSTNGLHSFSMRVENFRGRVGVQGTLATNPTESDWFSVLPDGIPYVQFPQPKYIVVSPQMGQTSTYGFNFTGNLVWVRATMDRTYILPPNASPMYVSLFGLVEHVLMHYGNAVGEYNYNRDWAVAPDPNKITGPQP